jgi:hypothetical protein
MSGKHTIIAEIPIEFHLSGAPEDEHETAYPSLELTYSFVRGCPARICWDENDHPAEPHELELLDVKVLDSDYIGLSDKEWFELAQNWIDDAGYDAAVDHAINGGHK